MIEQKGRFTAIMLMVMSFRGVKRSTGMHGIAVLSYNLQTWQPDTACRHDMPD